MKKRILCLFFAVLLLFSIFPLSVFADETTTDGSEGELESMDLSKTSIKYDFEYVFFNAFKLEDYKPNAAKGNIELITMTEVLAYRGYIELYLYVYNPSQKTVFDNEADVVTMSSYQGRGKFEKYEKYHLERVQVEYATKNTALETNASIIKYKLSGYSELQMEIERSYGISEIELSLKSGLQSFTVGKSFTFTDSDDGMLSVGEGTFKVMELEAKNTFYRVQSDGTGKYKDVRSVYFAVNNDDITAYGDLTELVCSWQRYTTEPILIVDDKQIYNDFKDYLGRTIPDDFKYSFGSGITSSFSIISTIPPFVPVQMLGQYGTRFNYAINGDDIPSKFLAETRDWLPNFELAVFPHKMYRTYDYFNDAFVEEKLYQTELQKLYWLFHGDVNEIIPGEELLYYTEEYSGGPGLEWSEELFADISATQKVTIDVKSKVSLDEYSITERALDWMRRWNKNKDILVNDTYKINLLQKFETKDLDLEREELSKKYYIDFNDVPDFERFVRENADSTIFLLRFDVTDTTIEKGSLFDTERELSSEFLPDAFSFLLGFGINNYACNSSLVQTVLISDFDIIQVTLGDETRGYTTFPVGMTPTDHAPDIGHLPSPDIDSPAGEFEEFMKMLEKLIKIIVIIAVIALIVYAFFVLSPYISAFFSRMGWGGGSNVSTNVNVNLSDEVEKKKNEVKKDEEKTD